MDSTKFLLPIVCTGTDMNQALNERFTGCIVAYRYLIVSEDCLVFENTREPIVIPGVEKIFKVC